MIRNSWLILAGSLSWIAALLHIAVIVGGPEWYILFGAGQELADLAAQGSLYPAILTLFIATVLFVWGLYAFSAAGKIRKLPFLNLALVAITAVYALRGGGAFVAMIFVEDLRTPFFVWSSLICGLYALAYGMGTFQYFKDKKAINLNMPPEKPCD